MGGGGRELVRGGGMGGEGGNLRDQEGGMDGWIWGGRACSGDVAAAGVVMVLAVASSGRHGRYGLGRRTNLRTGSACCKRSVRHRALAEARGWGEG